MRDVTQQDCVFVAKFGVHNYLSRNTFFTTAIVQAISTQFADKYDYTQYLMIYLLFVIRYSY